MPPAESPVAGSGLDSLLAAARKRAVKEGVLCRFGMLDSFPNVLHHLTYHSSAENKRRTSLNIFKL